MGNLGSSGARRIVVVFSWLFTLSVLAWGFLVPLGGWQALPDDIRILAGEEVDLDVGPLFSLKSVTPSTVELRLLGLWPVQRANVQVVDRVEVVPGGHAVGILLSAQGLVVSRTVPVVTLQGERLSPAAQAGVRPGDVLIRVGETAIGHPFELESMANAYGQRQEPMRLTLLRQGKEHRVDVQPVAVPDPTGRTVRYMLGLHLKDPAAGVGTLTFWHPSSGAYGALGHVVSEGEEAVPLNDGRIVSALIHGVHPGVRGRPGEKVGIFENDAVLGTIEKNTHYGIYGRLYRSLPGTAQTLPVALSHEVKEGPASLLTVLEGERVERFEVLISGVNPHAAATGRGLIIEVTDPRLLERTGGIVQGMSGSPLLQDGKLIGAVTHVFINNPRRGYGILAEWMVYEAGILTDAKDDGRNLLPAG